MTIEVLLLIFFIQMRKMYCSTNTVNLRKLRQTIKIFPPVENLYRLG